VQTKLGGLKEEDFKELESPDHLVKMDVVHREKSSNGILRASTVRPPPSRHPILPANLTLLADHRRAHRRGGRVGDGQDEQGELEGARRIRGT
jgi:hypothetical protein